MSLRVIFENRENDLTSNERIIRDVELAFEEVIIRGTTEEKELINKIDGGRYYNTVEFVDRFGVRRDISSLSTGCKTGLVILNSSDVVDTIECGINARDAILETCTKGSMIIHYDEITLDLDDDINIDVKINGHRVTSVGELSYYISENKFKYKGEDE